MKTTDKMVFTLCYKMLIMELKIPKNSDLLKPKDNNWDKFNEKATVECACGNIIKITANIKQYHTVKCNNCDLVYEVWNNSDGSGTRFNVKGYFPFYPDGYKFTIER